MPSKDTIVEKVRNLREGSQKSSKDLPLDLFGVDDLTPPLWLSADTIQSLIEESSGERARNHFRRLNLMGGYAPSPQFREIAEYVRDKAKEYGLEDVQLEGFQSDGEKFYWAFLTEPSWDARSGSLWIISPESRRLVDFAVSPCVLARYSRSVVVEAELVYVGEGVSDEDYTNRNVKGKIALATGNIGSVHAMAVYEHGALGVVTMGRNLARPDMLRSGQLMPWRGPDGSKATFGFTISYRQGQSLISDLERGPVRVRVEIDAKVEAGEYLEVTGVIPGSELPSEEVLLTAHTDHRNTGGNNATGDGVTLEMARTLMTLVNKGILPRPRRTIRFIWGPEHKGLIAYLYHHLEALKSWLYVLDFDLVGKSQKEGGSRLHLCRSPFSNPTVIDDAVQEVREWAVNGNRSLLHNRSISSFTGTRYFWPIIDPLGSSDDFLADTQPFWGPSDHEDLNDGNLGVHSVMFGDWPDPYLGAHQDNPDGSDPTQLKRNVVVGAVTIWALANMGPRDAEKLVALGSSRAKERMAVNLRKAMKRISYATKEALPREILEARITLREITDKEIRAFEALEPWLSADVQCLAYVEKMKKLLISEGNRILDALNHFYNLQTENIDVQPEIVERTPEEKAMIGRVPIRNINPRGPVNICRYRFGQAWLAKQLGNWDFLNLAIRGHGRFTAYESLNFVDGKRDLLQIRDMVSAEFGPVPASHISEYFEVMKKAGVIRFA